MRFLFTAFYHGLGHVVRSHTVAKELVAHGHEATLACAGAAHALLPECGVRLAPLTELRPFAPGKLPLPGARSRMADVDYLKTCLEEEGQLVEQYRPDCVVFDFRPVSGVVAARAGIPAVALSNAHTLSVFYPKMLREVDESLATLNVSETFRQKLLGDYIAIPDISRFEPLLGLPDDILRRIKLGVREIRHVGPILREHPARLDSREKLRERLNLKRSKLVYVSAGGSAMGYPALQQVVTAVQSLADTQTILVSGPNVPTDLFATQQDLDVCQYLTNSIEIIKAADLAIITAGHSTIWECLLSGTPTICIPLHEEQRENAERVVSLGLGRSIAPHALENELPAACRELLSEPTFSVRGRNVAQSFAQLDGARRCAEFLESVS